MERIKRFESFINDGNLEKIDEGLMDLIKKIPGVEKYYDQIQDVVIKVKDQVMDYIEDNKEKLSDEDLVKLSEFQLDKSIDLAVSESKDEEPNKKKVLNKILDIIGVSTAATGLLSGIYSMIIGAIEQSGYAATPWFITCVVLFIITGVANIIKDDEDDIKKKK